MRQDSPSGPAARAPMLRSTAVTAVIALALALPLGAQTLDLTVQRIQVNQAIQRANQTPLFGGGSTFVRATIGMTDPPAGPVLVDGVMRVLADGVEIEGSPFFSDNGPFEVPAAPDLNNEDDTLNFLFVAPTSDDVEVIVQVNPAGPNFVPEATTANNTTSTGSLAFGEQRVAELAYAPIDYRPSGGPTPNLPDAALIEPGVGDNFIQGIYPTPDWHYHRTDAPSKLWTSSLSGTGVSLLNDLQVDLALMDPQPDFLYAWIPGSIPYNGQAFIDGQVSLGNTQPIRHQRTFAHEVGHNFGLGHNSWSTNIVGVDVEHHLAITQSLPQIKVPSLKDIMFAGLLTEEAWVASANYEYFYDHAAFDPVPAPLAAGGDDEPVLLVTGEWNVETGALAITHVLGLPGGRATRPVPESAADLVVRTFAGGEAVDALLVAASTTTDAEHGCGSTDSATGTGLPRAAFAARVPAASDGGVPIDRLVVEQAGARLAEATVIERSAAPPEVAFTAPSGELSDARPTVAWTASDADGDALRFYLRYLPDGERAVPLANGLEATSFAVDLSELPALVDGAGRFELMASDGLNTTTVTSEPLVAGPSFAGGAGNDPWSHILTPDDGTSWLRGGTVILHGAGWDIEDRALDGASVVWSSDVDGAVGTGRVTSTDGLSVGSHVLTLTVTDGDGQIATDTASITIVDRELPDTSGEVCQTDLGFGGPGPALLEVCGGDLSSGTTADAVLTGGPANTTGWLVLGLVNAPTSVKGGTLVPVPWIALVELSTDGDGAATLAGLPGGGGPVTLYAQAALMDGAQPLGFAFSNAVQIDVGP